MKRGTNVWPVTKQRVCRLACFYDRRAFELDCDTRANPSLIFTTDAYNPSQVPDQDIPPDALPTTATPSAPENTTAQANTGTPIAQATFRFRNTPSREGMKLGNGLTIADLAMPSEVIKVVKKQAHDTINPFDATDPKVAEPIPTTSNVNDAIKKNVAEKMKNMGFPQE
jgi:hypothetical protein